MKQLPSLEMPMALMSGLCCNSNFTKTRTEKIAGIDVLFPEYKTKKVTIVNPHSGVTSEPIEREVAESYISLLTLENYLAQNHDNTSIPNDVYDSWAMAHMKLRERFYDKPYAELYTDFIS